MQETHSLVGLLNNAVSVLVPVKFVSDYSSVDDINLGVRSGGHSYGCTSSKVVRLTIYKTMMITHVA